MDPIYTAIAYLLELSRKQMIAFAIGFFAVLVIVIKLVAFSGGEQQQPVQTEAKVLQKPVQTKLSKNDLNRNIPPAEIVHLTEDTTGYKKITEFKASGARKIPAVWHGGEAYLPIVAKKTRNKNQWLKVMIQERPNGSTLWIPFSKDSMTVYNGSDVIDIDSKTGILRRYKDRRLLLKAPAVLGKPETPTPKGRFFVTHLAKTPNDSYGPFMLVTSAHSETIQDFGGIGDAIVAIHGPIDSSEAEIANGARLSNGCVRLKMSYLESLRDVKAGSLVIIR
jgi:hypothetical protein